MDAPRRRRNDRDAAARSAASADKDSASRWIAACAARLIEIDPSLKTAEAVAIAESLRSFERTEAMDPVQAAEFAERGISSAGGVRFERRG